jgi:hypothetical protein
VNQRDVLQRYPRIIAHMICESLGYFTVNSAANALLAYIEKKSYYCEWFDHMAGFQKVGTYEERMQHITQRTMRDAIRNRKGHRGYMAEYKHAIGLVKAELEREGVTSQMLASWF